jgi:uncharacterized protein DUF5667
VPAVNFDFFDRRSAERFAELLDEANGGRRHHSHHPADDHLAELVTIGHGFAATGKGPQVDPEFRVGLRAMLVATAERDGIGATATAVAAEPTSHADAHEPSAGLFGRAGGSGRRIRARGAIVIGVAAGAMAVSGISAASESAHPGDALYGVKRSTERAQLAMAGSNTTRGQLSLNFARTRLAEAVSLPDDDSGFGAVLKDMDADTAQGVKLLNGSAVARKQTAPLNTVDGFVANQRRAIEPMLERLSPANQERARVSLSLLEAVAKRSANLRAGLACETVTSAGPADALGPQLRGCMAGSNNSSTPERQQGTGEKAGQKPGEKSGARSGHKSGETAGTTPKVSTDKVATTTPKPAAPTVKTTKTSGAGGTTGAGTTGSTTGQVTGEQEPFDAPADQPAEDDGGLLGRTLSGILGH